MKKGILCSVTALVLVLGLALSVVTPVMASRIQLAKETDRTANKYYVGDTIHYVLNVTNPIGNAATNYLDVVEDILPDGSTVTLATNVIQAPGEWDAYYYDYVVDEADLQFIGGRWRVVNTLHVKGTDSLFDMIDARTSKSSFILRPAISINKTVDCNDDGVYSKTETTSGASDDADWKVVVTNTGFDPVYNITVTDTNGHSFGAPFNLAVNATKTFTYTTTISTTTTNTATAVGKDEIGGTVGPVSSNATNNIIAIAPNTTTTIAANATTVPINGKVSLTVIEQNTGGDNLTNPRVEVRQNGTLIATLKSTSGNFSGDNGNGILNTGETWKWINILSKAINATTTFEARGFGTDSQGHEVSYATGYLGERAVVIVNTLTVGWETYPVNKLRVLLPWVGLLAAVTVGAGLLVLRHRRI